MFPPQFDYRKPGDLDEALAALAEPDAVALAGGHDLLPRLKQRETHPGTVVDIGGLEALHGIESIKNTESGKSDDRLTVGALTTYAELLAAAPAGADALLDATGEVGDTQIRNRGTVGGNLAAAHPASDIPATVLALGATVHLTGPAGERSLETDAFYHEQGTACDGDELVTKVTVPRTGHGSAYARKTHPSTGYAAVGVAARLGLDGGTVSEARVAVTGLVDQPTRLDSVEEALTGAEATEDALSVAASEAGNGIDATEVRSDHLVSADQRLRLLPAYTERALTRALGRAAEETGVSA